MKYDIAVLGAGPGGYVAAIRAAQLGASVVVIEKEKLGGTCLNRGCIPTKALVAAAEKYNDIKKASEFGIEIDNYKMDFRKAHKRKNEIVDKLVNGIHFLFKKNKIDLVSGEGLIKNKNEIVVTKENENLTVHCKNMIIATGSSPALIKSLGYDGESVITSEEALNMEEIPKSLIIIGAGVIGCEFASIYESLGTEVILVEAMPNILPTMDKEISRRMQTIFKKKNVSINTKVKIEKVSSNKNGVEAILENGKKITAEKALISIGRSLNTNGIGLENIGVEIGERGEIIVNERMKTNVNGVYAIGDITNMYQLAHVASAQGIAASENIMGKETVMEYDSVPGCIFTSPEIAAVGITSEDAKKNNIPVKTGKFNFISNGKALSMRENEGLVKIIAHKENDTVLGVHILGPHASDLIHEAVIAVKKGLTSEDITKTIHAHPTLAETMMEAAESVHGLSIHS